MNTRKALLLLAGFAVTASSVYAEKVTLQQTPPAVQQAIRSKSGRSQIEDIDKDVRNGQVTYEASWKAGTTQQELLVSESGTILRDVVGPSTGLSNQNLTLANKTSIALTEAPQPVQIAINNRLLNVPVETVQRGVWNGQNIYEVTYQHRGQLRTYQVTETGQPVVSNIPAPGFQPRYSGVADKNLSLSGGAKVAFTEAPEFVQRTVTHIANGARIEDFERGQWNGRTVYEAAFKRNGENIELQVVEDGSVVTKAPTTTAATTTTAPVVNSQPYQPRIGNGVPTSPEGAIQSRATRRQQPAAWQPRYAGLSQNNVPIANGAKITFTEAPRPVQETIGRLTNGARIDDFERGLWNGRTVYEAAFKQNGLHTEVQILDDGSILTSAPLNATGAPPTGVSGQQRN